jgi:hypothetical protein
MCKDSGQNAYRVVRQNGSPVGIGNDKLSEGERNFLALLYFYFRVQGSLSDTDSGKEKIVVIDDPVSSMDSGVLFIVGQLVRELIDECYKDGWNFGIKQIFILTHNVFFHKEISYNQVLNFRKVSFFAVNKKDEKSSVKACVQPCIGRLGEEENYTSVKNPYEALWSEYREVDSPITLSSAQSEFDRNKRFLEGLYESLIRGDICDTEYKDMKFAYEDKIALLTERIKRLREEVYTRVTQETVLTQAHKSVQKIEQVSDLTVEIIDRLIEKITVCPNGCIEVKFRFLSETVCNKEDAENE